MNPQMQQQIMARLDALSQKLGVAAGVLWQATVRQEFINGWECVAGALLLGIAVTACAALLYKFRADEDAGWLLFPAFACTAGMVICAFNAVDLLANPTFWAFKDLLEAIK